jgi:hypothetical protein
MFEKEQWIQIDLNTVPGRGLVEKVMKQSSTQGTGFPNNSKDYQLLKKELFGLKLWIVR